MAENWLAGRLENRLEGKNRKTLRLGSSNQGLPQQQNGMQATALLNGIVVLAADTEEKNLAMAGMEKEK